MIKNKRISGQSLIEFALLFPLLFLLIMGLFDLGRAVFFYTTINTAVREGTRFAIVQSDCSYKSSPSTCSGSYLDSYPLNCDAALSEANIAICTEVRNKLFSISDLMSSTITIDHLDVDTNDPLISIDIDYLFHPITPGVAMLGDLTLHANSQMLLTPLAKP
jgi:hypothetical protein